MSQPELTRSGDVFLIDFGDDDNVTSEAWITRMHELLDEIDATEGAKALVTTGSAKHYSNGLDVGFMATLEPDGVNDYVKRVLTVTYRLMFMGMPTVAAVNGHAFGMGAFLVVAHDQAVMREDRGFVCFPEVHLGMPIPAHLMSIAQATLAPRTLRYAVATGHRFTGPAAAAAGIVDTTAPLDSLVAEATALVEPLAGTASDNLSTLKRQLFPAVHQHAAG